MLDTRTTHGQDLSKLRELQQRTTQGAGRDTCAVLVCAAMRHHPDILVSEVVREEMCSGLEQK